ncbi:MAG: AAA family ATPase, partial [Candidatus Woesearchaeota archaeon]
MALLIERYAPQSLAQIPQPGISVLRNCVKKQLEGKLSGKAVFIYGPTGCGKTTAVKCLARELGLELFELNASDFRSSKDLEVTLMPAVSQSSLWAASRLILLDELDGLDPSEDGGAVGTILAAIKLSKHPIVLVANEPWTAQLAPLREKAILIEFQKIPIKIIFNTLKNICQKEGTAYDMQALALL